MSEILIAGLIFFCLLAASLGSLAIYDRFPAEYRQEDTHDIVKNVANIFVVMTSLALGLMINSAKNTFEAVDHNVHVFATELILLDRKLLQYGSETADARQRLLAYVQQVIDGKWNTDGPLVADDRVAELRLREAGDSLMAIRPPDADHAARWNEVQRQFEEVADFHWVLAEQSEGTIPMPLIAMVVAWLILIFASFGYRAPKNPVVVLSFVVAAFLISGAIHLILNMDIPFAGPIQVSPAPLQRVIVEMQG